MKHPPAFRLPISVRTITLSGLAAAVVIAATLIAISSRRNQTANSTPPGHRITHERAAEEKHDNWMSELLASPAGAGFRERFEATAGGKSFEELLADIRHVKTSVLLRWLDGLDGSDTLRDESSFALVVSACVIDLARRNHPEAPAFFGKLGKILTKPDAFRLIAENLVKLDPNRTAALIDQSKRENIKGIDRGCCDGLLAYLWASGDLETTLKNSECLPVLDRTLIFERMDLRHLVERGHTLPEMIAACRAVGKADGSGFGTAIWRKLAASFELGEVMAAAGSGLSEHDIQAVATGVIRRDPATSVAWLVENSERDPNHAIFNAVVREWVAVDTTRASEQLGKITSPSHLKMAARELALAAEAEGNHAAAAAWLRVASQE